MATAVELGKRSGTRAHGQIMKGKRMSTTIASTLHSEGSLPALRALAERIATEVDRAEFTSDLAPLARTLRLVLATIASLEAKQAGTTTAKTYRRGSAVDQLVEKRRKRLAGQTAGGAA